MPSTNDVWRRLVTKLIAVLGLAVFASAGAADDWPQWRGPQRDGVWRETGIVESFDGEKLDIVWRASIGSGYSGPTVADGRVYVTDRVVIPNQIERVHCFDSTNGKPIWTHEYDCPYRDVGYDAGPRASVTIDGTRAYALGTMGHFFCFDAATGATHWEQDLNALYKIRMPIWGIASAPLIERDLVIVQIGGEDGACLVAFDKKTGRERWKALDDQASYSAPIVVEQGGNRVLVCYTGDNVVGLDPDSGKVHWKHPFPPRQMVIGIASPVFDRGRLFVSNFFDGSLMLQLSEDGQSVKKLWQRAGQDEKNTDALHSIISTPILRDDHIYGVDSYGELRCLNAATGDRLWESLKAGPHERWGTIHLVEHGDRTWMFNEKGALIIAELSPQGYREIDRALLIDPTREQLPSRRGGVTWAHPAFADKHIFARNDKELVCASLAK